MQLHAIVLAAGQGKRLNSTDTPKVMLDLNGKPVLAYVLGTIREVGIRDVIIVVGFQGQKVIDYFGNKYRYVWQRKRLGTAHAALQAQVDLRGLPGHTFILYGDNPLLSADTLRHVVSEVKTKKATLGLTVAKAPEELELGIVVTDKDMRIKAITEQKVATTELKRNNPWRNTGSWLVENQWLWQALPKIAKNPKTGEYYLTDLASLAALGEPRYRRANLAHKLAIAVPVADPAEAIGINTTAHLKQAAKWLRTHARR